MRYLPIALGVVLALAVMDFYVYRNWRLFARYRKRSTGWTLPVYRVLMAIMPLTLPLYLSMFRWWEVEPKLVRAAFVGLWVIYYVPKIPIAAVLLIKDATRVVSRQFRWLKNRSTHADRPNSPETGPDITELRGMTRSDFLRRMGWSAASIPFIVVGFGVLRSLYHFEVQEWVVRSSSLPSALDGLRIAHISDLHAGSLFSEQPLRDAIALLNEQHPDLVAFTGDFVNHDARELETAIAHLRTIRSELGAFACLGNHDHYARVNEVVASVAETPFNLLINAHETIEVDGARLYVVGTDNTGFNQHYADLPRALEGIPHETENDFRLLLAHDPSYWDHVRTQRPDIDLTLSGHTHGGQVGFEMGPMRWSLARLVYPRWAGLYREARRSESPQFLYVNRGLGTVGPPVRIGVRPEITILTLKRV